MRVGQLSVVYRIPDRYRADLEHTALFSHSYPASAKFYTLSLHDALPISTVSIQNGRPIWRLICTESDWSSRLKNGFGPGDRKSTRLNSSHVEISYAVFCLKKKTYREDASPSGSRNPG